jgi:hypothetical protein
VDSNKSSTSISANHSRSKKIILPEFSKARKLHLTSLSRENRKGDYDGHLKDNIPSQNVSPLSPMKTNSRFKEQLEGPSLKPSIVLGKGNYNYNLINTII